MVGLSKTFNDDGPTMSKPLKKPSKPMVVFEKTLTIPSLWKIDHCRGLVQKQKEDHL